MMQCFAKEPCTSCEEWAGMMKLPVTTFPQLWLFSSYCIPQPVKNFSAVL
jgi:hypothetical protein